VKHRVVGLASRIFNGGKNIFSLQKGVISENFFERGLARQEIQNIGNAETKTANAGAASALSFFHRYSLQPFDAHKLESTMVWGKEQERANPAGAKNHRPHQERSALRLLVMAKDCTEPARSFFIFREEPQAPGRLLGMHLAFRPGAS